MALSADQVREAIVLGVREAVSHGIQAGVPQGHNGGAHQSSGGWRKQLDWRAFEGLSVYRGGRGGMGGLDVAG